MKLKEKLAGEYATWIRHPLNAAGETREEKHFNQDRYLGFLAGFEKAREMAAAERRNACMKYCGGMPCSCLIHDIEELGEKEAGNGT